VSGTAERIGVVHVGLGPIGRSVASIVARHPALRAVAAVDPAPELTGRPLADVIGTDGASPLVITSLGEVRPQSASVALHCTGSSLDRVLPQLLQLIDLGMHVVSTCEELSYPWATHRHAATELHARARDRGVTVLGTGVNPGFAMDYLPVVLASVMERVDQVTVTRVADASRRRLPLQRKVGVGLSAAEFRERVKQGQMGHVGLRESAESIAAAFGWTIESYSEEIDPVIAESDVSTSSLQVTAGLVLGLHHVASAVCQGQPAIVLDLTLAANGEDRDVIALLGRPNVWSEIPGGLHGDTATAAIVVNAIPRVLSAPRGLVTMLDLAPPHPWARLTTKALATV
jgi:2,4-diaminopentanoate dehydrogenase